MQTTRILIGLFMLGGVAAAGQFPSAETSSVPGALGMERDLGDIVVVRDVSRSGQTVVGRVVNRGAEPIGDVRLEFEHTFLWQDERNPGVDDPSRRESATLEQTIAPGESVTFQHRLTSPLPQRSDGTFMTNVEPVGVTQMPRSSIGY